MALTRSLIPHARRGVFVGLALALLCFPQIVLAQGATTSSIPVAKEKMVIFANPLIKPKKGLQGAVGAYLGFDSNLTYGIGNTDADTYYYEKAIPALSFRLNAMAKWTTGELHKRFEAESPFQYGLQLGVEYHQPYEMVTENGAYNDPRFSGFLKGVLYWKPSSHFNVQLYEIMNRYSKTHYLFKNDFVMSWIHNEVGVHTRIIPGDGLLEFNLNYNMGLTLFEDSELEIANRIAHNVGVRGGYRFLPHSLAWLAITYDFYQYLSADNRDSMPIKFYGGVSTPLWMNLGLNLGGGYGMGISGEMPSTWLVRADINYTLASRLKIGVGYSHDFTDSLISHYSESHIFRLFGVAPLSQKMLLQGQTGVQLVSYVGTDAIGVQGTDGSTTRTDTILFLDLSFSYKLSKDFIASASYRFMMDTTPFSFRVDDTPEPTVRPAIDNDPSFMKHEIYIALQYLF